MSLLKNLDYEVVANVRRDRLPRTIAARTKRVYDILSTVYPLSTYCFHSKAHKLALQMSGIHDGMRVLEIATGSGEMFRRLVKANGTGETMGFDLSPKMAARTHKQVQRDFPSARTQCHAVDARYLPFPDYSFDAIVCCYLLELLSQEDIVLALQEFHRVLRPNGTFTLVCIGQNAEIFNGIYRVVGTLAPAFWGRQVDERVPQMIRACSFHLRDWRQVRQSGYPSRVFVAEK